MPQKELKNQASKGEVSPLEEMREPTLALLYWILIVHIELVILYKPVCIGSENNPKISMRESDRVPRETQQDDKILLPAT